MLPAPALGNLVESAAPIKEPETNRVAEAFVNGRQSLRQPTLNRCHGFDACATASSLKAPKRVDQSNLGLCMHGDDDRFETRIEDFLNFRQDRGGPSQLPLRR